jgi:hypothetical protein
MTQTELLTPPPYPTDIVTEPFTLDDLKFTPTHPGQIERATRNDRHVGDVLVDRRLHSDGKTTIETWFARKVDANDELSDWKPMRCAAEARAFLVSRVKQ